MPKFFFLSPIFQNIIQYLFQVCREWKEIAIVTRSKVFKDTEPGQAEIDLFDVKVRLIFFFFKAYLWILVSFMPITV